MLAWPVLASLVLAPPLLWAQRASPLEENPIPPFGRAGQLAPVLEAKIPVPPVSTQLLLFKANQGQTESRVRFFPPRTDSYHMPINNQTAWEVRQPPGAAEILGPANLMGRAPNQWLMFALTSGKLPDRTIQHADDLGYYGRHTPGAGSIILGIAKWAKAHPHAARVLKLLEPQF